MPMNELMLSLLVWIGANSSYPIGRQLPNIVFTEPYNMCAVYGISQKQRCKDMKLKGFYNKRLSIYLRPDFDINNPHHQSQLLHELIHYVQFRNIQNNAGTGGL